MGVSFVGNSRFRKNENKRINFINMLEFLLKDLF